MNKQWFNDQMVWVRSIPTRYESERQIMAKYGIGYDPGQREQTIKDRIIEQNIVLPVGFGRNAIQSLMPGLVMDMLESNPDVSNELNAIPSILRYIGDVQSFRNLAQSYLPNGFDFNLLVNGEAEQFEKDTTERNQGDPELIKKVANCIKAMEELKAIAPKDARDFARGMDELAMGIGTNRNRDTMMFEVCRWLGY